MLAKITWTHILKATVVLAIAMPFVITYGIFKDDQYNAAETATSLPSPVDFNLMSLLVKLFIVYALRIIIPAVIYQFISLRRGQGMLTCAVKACILFEGLIIFIAFSPAEPTDPNVGVFSGNGLDGLAMIGVLMISVIAQVIGMIIGSIIGFGPKNPKTQS